MAQDVVAVADTATEVRPFTRYRKYLLIANVSDADIYLSIGGTAVVGEGIPLSAGGGSYEMSKDRGNLDMRAISAIHGDTGDKDLTWTEYP